MPSAGVGVVGGRVGGGGGVGGWEWFMFVCMCVLCFCVSVCVCVFCVCVCVCLCVVVDRGGMGLECGEGGMVRRVGGSVGLGPLPR